jgi:hypothetical protein
MLLAILALALATSPSAITITPADGATGVDITSVITLQTPEMYPSIEVYEAISGVRVAGKVEPFVSRPKGRSVMRFAPTHRFKARTTYKVLVGGRTFSFTTKPGPRAISLAIDGASA